MYTDGNYPRGIDITYLLDGWKSYSVNYLDKTMFPEESLTKKTLPIRKDVYIKRVLGTRQDRCLHTLTIELSDQRKIMVGSARGGAEFEYEVPDGYLPYVFTGCYFNGYPFPAIINIGLKIVKKGEESEPIDCVEKKGNIDRHKHFDPISEHQSNFVRLLKIEIITVKRNDDKQSSERSFSVSGA